MTIAPGDVDEISEFENLLGGAGNDWIEGTTLANVLSGGGGNDRLDGGDGLDTADYAYLSTALTATLAAGSTLVLVAATGDTDTLVSIENIFGGAGNDTLVGNANDNVLRGSAGDDTLDGGSGGNDTADFAYAAGAITASLDASGGALVTVASGDTDLLAGIENLVGGAGNDMLSGNAAANILSGGAGDDLLSGEAGDDRFAGGAGFDRFFGGNAGADAGFDRVDYSYMTSAFTLSFVASGATTVTLAGGDTDTLSGIEAVVGGSGADTLTASGGPAGVGHVLDGGAGNDLLVSRKGLQTLANAGDTLVGGDGADIFGVAGYFQRVGDGSFGDFDKVANIVGLSTADGDFVRVYTDASAAGGAGSMSSSTPFQVIGTFYTGTNSGAFSGAVIVYDTQGGLYFDPDVTTPGYSVLARVASGDIPIVTFDTGVPP